MRRLVLGAVGFCCLMACGSDTGDGPDASGRDGGITGDAGVAPLPACGTDSIEALMGCVEQSRYVADLENIVGERSPGTAHHDEVRELCATRLAELGFTIERHDYGTGVNIIGTRLGSAEPGSLVLLSAHYDSTRGCDGADDNATGVAGLLESARVLAMHEHERTLVVACWDEEERGLVGSRAYADRANAAGDDIAANFVYEMIGYFDPTPGAQVFPEGFDLLFPRAIRPITRRGSPADFIALIGDELHSADTIVNLTETAARVGLQTAGVAVNEALKLSTVTGDLRRSDHGGFWAHDDPGIMITDTANFRYDRYHCSAGPDTIDQLDHDFATQVIQMTVGAARQSLAR